jgi:V/A-type H+-transporting ATPase subunit I
MTIVRLERATFVGLSSDKEQLLDDLHRFGSLEIIPLGKDENAAVGGGPSSHAREALKFLLAAPQRRRQVHDRRLFDAAHVEQSALGLQSRIQSLEAERDDLVQRLRAAKPFGDFQFAPPEQMGDLRLWFYVVPHKEMAKLETTSVSAYPGTTAFPGRRSPAPPRIDGLERPSYEERAVSEQTPRIAAAWEVVARDNRFCYVVVVSNGEPENMPVPRVRIGSRSPSALARRLEEVELAIEDAQAERAYLTRWCLLFAHSLATLEDAAARAGAAQQTRDLDPLFALEAWVPCEHVDELAAYAQQRGIVFEHRPPAADENPPTLMHNAPRVEAGEDLVNFYMTPGYWTWDPSAIVFVSFAIFFAMILADAGYAAVLGLGVLWIWRKLGRPTTGDALLTSAADIEQGQPAVPRTAGQRFRPILLLIVLVSLGYGVLVGSYFGLAPPPDSLPGRLHILDMNNAQLMMGISVLVGALHVILANVMDARRYADCRDGLASLGWAAAVCGGLLAAAGAAIPAVAMLKIVGGVTAVIGLLCVAGFTARREKPLGRLIGGLLGLTKISAAFGDILSYLRLFALGLASASLATAFNDMAADIRGGLPRIGLLFALLVLLFGHALNLLLGVSSGVIHGLRLNVIEFFNWGLKDEGRRFTPFRRKEGSIWN